MMSHENESNLMGIINLVEEYVLTKSSTVLDIIELHLSLHNEELDKLIETIVNERS